MRVRFLPFVWVGLLGSWSLFFLRISFPGLVRLLVRTFIRLLSGVIFRRFFAHRFLLGRRAKRQPLNGSNLAGNEFLSFPVKAVGSNA